MAKPTLGMAYQSRNRVKKAGGGFVDKVINTIKETFQEPKPADKEAPGYKNRDLDPQKIKKYGFDKLAEGGPVKANLIKQRQPRMVESSVIKIKPTNEEKMAEGGMLEEKQEESKIPNNDVIGKSDSLFDVMKSKRKEMNEEEAPESDEEEQDQHDSIVSAIMAKRQQMAEGGLAHAGDDELEDGQVDIDDNASEQPNSFDELNEEALKENYDSDFMSVSQPEDSNLKGRDIDSDEHDMVSKIRAEMNKRRQFKVK